MDADDVVLVGVDGSPASLNAVDWAAAHAERHGQGIHLVCTYAVPSFSAAAMDGGYASLDDTAILEGAQAVLDEAKARLAGRGLRVTSAVATGDAAAVLVERSRSAALVVVGTRGRGGFAERLLGTVSSALPAHAHCPTVVVPYRRREIDEERPLPTDRGSAAEVEVAPSGRSVGRREVLPVRSIVVGVDGSPSAEVAQAPWHPVRGVVAGEQDGGGALRPLDGDGGRFVRVEQAGGVGRHRYSFPARTRRSSAGAAIEGATEHGGFATGGTGDRLRRPGRPGRRLPRQGGAGPRMALPLPLGRGLAAGQPDADTLRDAGRQRVRLARACRRR